MVYRGLQNGDTIVSTHNIPQENRISERMETRRIGRINTVGLYTLCNKEVRRFMKVWMQTIAAPAITTVLFMVIFTLAFRGRGAMLEGSSYATFLAPGLIMMAILQNAYANTTSSILVAKVQGNIVDVLMPPLNAFELTLGFMVGGIIRGVGVGVVTLLAFILLMPWIDLELNVHSIWAILFFGLMASIFLSLAGILTGIWADKFDHASTISNFVITPLSLLSGTFYTIERLPAAWQVFSHMNPFFYIIDGFRYGFIGHAESNLMIGAVYCLVINVILWGITQHVFTKGYRLKA